MVLIAHAYIGKGDHDVLPRAHAVALASAATAKLVSVHASPLTREELVALPPAHHILKAWGRDPASVEEDQIVEHGREMPLQAVVARLRELQPDLVVVGTAQRSLFARLFAESGATLLAESLPIPTLIVPERGRSFVGPHGEVHLEHAVVPAGDADAAAQGIERLEWFVELARARDVKATLTHVGFRPGDAVAPADHPHIRWQLRELGGTIERGILDAAQDANIVVMATRGANSLYDNLVGTHTERVLREVECPLLAVPMH